MCRPFCVVDVDTELPLQILRDARRCRSRGVLSFLGWIRLQKLLNFAFNVFVDLAGTALAVSVEKTLGAFLVESAGPLVDGRMRQTRAGQRYRRLKGRGQTTVSCEFASHELALAPFACVARTSTSFTTFASLCFGPDMPY